MATRCGGAGGVPVPELVRRPQQGASGGRDLRAADGRSGAGLQQAISLDVPSVAVDGIVGPVTWEALVSGMLSG